MYSGSPDAAERVGLGFGHANLLLLLLLLLLIQYNTTQKFVLRTMTVSLQNRSRGQSLIAVAGLAGLTNFFLLLLLLLLLFPSSSSSSSSFV